MTKRALFNKFLLLTVLLFGGGCSGNDDVPDTPDDNGSAIELPGALEPVHVNKSNSMKVFAHYMPWFETPETTGNGTWGQHWTMATCNPDKQDANGKREIASHYYPIIGPYASSDANVLNYHALLMKYSGIDGVMIDWYGLQEKYDYPDNHRNTKAMIEAIERVGLHFAIVYEDATLEGLSDKVTQAQRDIRYLETNYFSKENYVKVNGKPLLMIFGPQQIQKAADWTNVFNILSEKPAFVVLNGFSHCANDNSQQNAVGEFLWVNGNPDYNNVSQFDMYIGGAMPGFYDYYQQGNWGEGYTTYEHENGALFERQLAAAQNAGLEYLQISTWNDFGEGTTIEPTEEYGYRYLTQLQDFTGVSFQESNLKLIHRWYELKVKYKGTQGTASQYLTQAFYHLIALQPDKAQILIDAVDKMKQ